MSAVVCFGEVLIRLTAPDHELLLQSPRLQVCTGGAEANVAVALTCFGDEARLVSVLPDNRLGHAAMGELRRHGVDGRWIHLSPGRMGLYFLSTGAVLRPSAILYDRAGSAFALAPADLIDWSRALDGASWLHVSGINPVISANASRAVLRVVEEARARGVRISFDGNHRASMWAACEHDPRPVLRLLLQAAELAFITDQDIAVLLEDAFEGVTAEDRRLAAGKKAFEAFPNLQRIACTVRVPHGVTAQDISALMLTRETAHRSGPHALAGIIDRIGSGDAFAAGVLHGLVKGWADQQALDFGLAAACLKHSIPGDFTAVTEKEVCAALAGDLNVRR